MSEAFLAFVGSDSSRLLAGEFAEPFSISDPTLTTTYAALGIYDDTYSEVDPETGALVMSTHPRITIYEPDFKIATGIDIPEGIEEGWTLTIRGTTYDIDHKQPDGTGWVMLTLLRNRN